MWPVANYKDNPTGVQWQKKPSQRWVQCPFHEPSFTATFAATEPLARDPAWDLARLGVRRASWHLAAGYAGLLAWACGTQATAPAGRKSK